MSNYSKTFTKTKAHIKKYLNNKLSTFDAPIKRTINEIFYGVLHSGDVMLSNIGRSLNESTSIKKIVERLSRNISHQDFSIQLEDNHLKDISLMVNKKTVIVIDDTDIHKPRAKNMEAICPIRDGSTGETGMGYYLQNSCIVSDDRKEIKSVLTRIYSTQEKRFY